jgi:osmotically-inducible protein OsmY
MDSMRDELPPQPDPRKAPADQALERGRSPDAGVPTEPRSWLARTGDEVASWFGDAAAASRRQRDKAVGDHSGQGPNAKIDTDARIRDELNQRLTADPQIDASLVEVEVAAGAVVLSGSVSTTAERRRAEDLAMGVTGVSQVNNRLLVA